MEKTRILLVGMPSSHFFRWVSNIYQNNYELYWYNIMNLPYGENYSSFFKKIYFTRKERKCRYLKGEYLLSKNAPQIYNLLRPYLEVTENEIVEEIIKEVQPDIIHNLEMQSCTYPIIQTLKKHPNRKRIYSCWGSDLFHFQNSPDHRRLIKKAFKNIDLIHTDNVRDQIIAENLGYKGKFTEVIPGGGGYDIDEVSKNFKPFLSRKFILVKGYEHTMGRAINIIKALALLRSSGYQFEVVIFGAHPKLISHIKVIKFDAIIYKVKEIEHTKVMELMGNSYIYIGNSISDGLPNTLIESFLMGAFPIQSNPGGATAELVEHQVNGTLINDPENVDEIRGVIQWVLENKENLEQQVMNNHIKAKQEYSIEKVQVKINSLYKKV